MTKRVAPLHQCDAYVLRRSICIVVLLFVVALETFLECANEESTVVAASMTANVGGNAGMIRLAAKSNSTASYNKFGFFLMGDIPYANWELEMLDQQVEAINHNLTKMNHLRFTVHVGDFQKVDRTMCAESHYELVATRLQAGHLPTVMTPGDNDWFDCKDREESFSFFQKHMAGMEKKWTDKKLPVVRSINNPELFTFVQENILFVSIHLINGRQKDESVESWDGRMSRNVEWVEKHIAEYFAAATPEHPARGIIILGHSLRSPRTRPFFEALATNFVTKKERLRIPVIYLHGDGHKWDLDRKFSHQLRWKHFYDLQIDQGAFADPCIVEVAEQENGKLRPLLQEHANQTLFLKGLIRIDRQRGRYSPQYLKDFAAHLGEEAKPSRH